MPVSVSVLDKVCMVCFACTFTHTTQNHITKNARSMQAPQRGTQRRLQLLLALSTLCTHDKRSASSSAVHTRTNGNVELKQDSRSRLSNTQGRTTLKTANANELLKSSLSTDSGCAYSHTHRSTRTLTLASNDVARCCTIGTRRLLRREFESVMQTLW